MIFPKPNLGELKSIFNLPLLDDAWTVNQLGDDRLFESRIIRLCEFKSLNVCLII